MSKRDWGKEIIQGLEEIKAWKRGEAKLKTSTVERPRAAESIQFIRSANTPSRLDPDRRAARTINTVLLKNIDLC